MILSIVIKWRSPAPLEQTKKYPLLGLERKKVKNYFPGGRAARRTVSDERHFLKTLQKHQKEGRKCRKKPSMYDNYY